MDEHEISFDGFHHGAFGVLEVIKVQFDAGLDSTWIEPTCGWSHQRKVWPLRAGGQGQVGSNTTKLACFGWVYVTCKFFPYWNDETESWAASSTCKEDKENFLTWTMVKGPTSVPRGSYTRRPIQDGQCWAMDQVVVANHRTNKNLEKRINCFKAACIEWSCSYICTFSYIIFIHTVAIASR